MRTLSTSEAAEKLGIHRVHLQRLIAQGNVKAPPALTMGRTKVRLWSERDVERVSKALGKRRKGKANRKRVTA
jgi:excisionase family DNA binding protein